jgi:hypothetical protein
MASSRDVEQGKPSSAEASFLSDKGEIVLARPTNSISVSVPRAQPCISVIPRSVAASRLGLSGKDDPAELTRSGGVPRRSVPIITGLRAWETALSALPS